MRYAKSFVMGLLGAALALVLWHAYLDHQNLHALVTMVQQARAQQAEPAK